MFDKITGSKTEAKLINKEVGMMMIDMKLVFLVLVSLSQGFGEDQGLGIIGGTPVQTGEYPFAAAIYTTTNLGRYFCGGTIIHEQWILTAAQCIQEGVSFSIHVGSSNLKVKDRVILNATSSVIHPDFDKYTLVNNIGLINLPDPLTFNDRINKINLPDGILQDGTQVTSIGWGQIDERISGPVDNLHKTTLVTLTNDQCKRTYGEQISDGMVCAAGSYNEGTCIGDIGGPLIHTQHGEHVQVGIASFLSANGCESLDPSGFTRTYKYLTWIKNVVQEN